MWVLRRLGLAASVRTKLQATVGQAEDEMSNRIAVMLISMIAAAVLLAVPAPSDAKLLMWKLDGVSRSSPSTTAHKPVAISNYSLNR
jgi:hypothetical protein